MVENRSSRDNNMNIKLEKLEKFKDKRGYLVEVLRKNELDKKVAFGHLFFVTFANKTSIRGNHYHKKTYEYYVVMYGRMFVHLKDIQSGEEIKFIMRAQDHERLRIGPFIAHASYSLSRKTILLAYNSLPYSKMKPDTFTYKLL